MAKNKDAARQAMRDRVRQKAKESQEGKQGGSMLLNLKKPLPTFKEKVARYTLDLIPYEVTIPNHPDGIAPGNLWYKMPYAMHWVNEKPYICPGTFGKKCPICLYYAQLKKDGEEEAAKAIKKKEKVLYNVVPRGSKNFKEELHLWDISFYNFQDQLEDRLEDAPDEWLDFMFPEDGKSLSIKFKKKTLGTTDFPQTSQIDFLDREELDEDLLASAVPLDTALKVLSYEALEKVLYMEEEPADEGAESDDAESTDDEDEKPVRKKKAAKPEPEEDEEDPDDEPEEDEEEKKPVRKKKPAPEPEPEEEEDDEEDDPPPPKKKAKEEKKPEKSEGKKGKCPHGHTFGKDCDNFPEDCDECDLWEACDSVE